MERWILNGIFLGFLIFLFVYDQNKRIVTSEYQIQADVQHGFCIVHLSDLHSATFHNLISKVKKKSPDLIVITGVLINDRGKHVSKMLSYVNRLTTICPVFYVTGNHERRLGEFENVMQQISQAGATVLLNECTAITIHGQTIHILGLDENQGSFQQYKERRKGNFIYRDNSACFETLCKSDGFKLVLSHFPENFACIGNFSYQQFPFDLMLAGHAHGGQFDLPFIGPVFSPGQGLFPKYAKGKFGDRPALIVSRGLGNSEFPLRLCNHPELVVIKIEKRNQSV